MASRGQSVAGTDGSDHSFRQTVAKPYKEIPKIQEELKRTISYLLFPYYLLIAALAVYTNLTFGKFPFHSIAYPVIFLSPFIASQAMSNPKHRKLLMVLYSTVCGAIGAYVLAIGVGRTLTGLEQRGLSSLGVAVLVGHSFGVLAHIYGVYHCRRLISRYDFHRSSAKKQ